MPLAPCPFIALKILRSQHVSLCRVAVSPYIDIVLLFYIDCRVQRFYLGTEGLGGVRDVASAIMSHEWTQ